MNYVKTVRPFHRDQRGEMYHLLDGKVKIVGALLVTCKEGAVRANHYHKKDTHYTYIIKGSMQYTYRTMRRRAVPKKTVLVKEGQIVVSPPMIAHAMKFLEDSVFLALTTEQRGKKHYEHDTVRIKLI